MHHADHISFVAIFILHSIIRPAHSKDFENTFTMENRNTHPITGPHQNIFVSYSHNPLGESYKMIQNEKSEDYHNENRSKRGILELYNMVVCATNCNPLAYKGYGCYCGFLGSGYPVDPIDRCCKEHDWCYNLANCPMFLEYFTPYTWTCYTGQPICFAGWSCSVKLCECDRQLAQCLKNYACPRRKAVCTSSSWRLFQNLISI